MVRAKFMHGNRQIRCPISRFLLALTIVGLFTTAYVGFPFLHNHKDERKYVPKHSGKHSSDHCNVCLAHATASSAVEVDTEVPTESMQTLVEIFLSAPETVASHAPITADSRGPPAVL